MDPKQIVLAFGAAQGRLDMDGSMELLSEDVVYHNMPFKPIVGRENVRSALAAWPIESCQWDFTHIMSDGNVVLTERVDYFTKDGGRIVIPVMGAFEVKDGLITHWRDYFDAGAMRPQA